MQVKTHAGKEAEQGKDFTIAGGSTNLHSHNKNQYECFSERWELIYEKIQLDHFGHISKECFNINSHYTFLGKYFFFIFYRTLIYKKEKRVS